MNPSRKDQSKKKRCVGGNDLQRAYELMGDACQWAGIAHRMFWGDCPTSPKAPIPQVLFHLKEARAIVAKYFKPIRKVKNNRRTK